MNTDVFEKELGMNITQNLSENFAKFHAVFLKHCAKTNLVSKNDEKLLWEKHIFDSCAIVKFEPFKNVVSLLDIGTGGGFPALPLAIACPDIQITAVDSIAKKIDVIKEIKNELKIRNLTPVCARSENLGAKYIEYFDMAASRAVAPLNIILEFAVPYIKINGYFAAYKSQSWQQEIEEAQNALRTLNCEVYDVIDYNLPLDENFTRKLIIIKKKGETPEGYPRLPGEAKSRPL